MESPIRAGLEFYKEQNESLEINEDIEDYIGNYFEDSAAAIHTTSTQLLGYFKRTIFKLQMYS